MGVLNRSGLKLKLYFLYEGIISSLNSLLDDVRFYINPLCLRLSEVIELIGLNKSVDLRYVGPKLFHTNSKCYFLPIGYYFKFTFDPDRQISSFYFHHGDYNFCL